MKKLLLGISLPLLVTLLLGLQLRHIDRESGEAPQGSHDAPGDLIEHGRTLVTLADCRACHTARGGAAFAGGRAIPTRFGTFYAPNITPDVETGIGRWSAEDFWRALHNGYSRDGRPLYPAFPYTNYTKISRRDALAMFEYLKTVEPVHQVRREHDLAFPYRQRTLLIAWRWLFFRPGVYERNPEESAEWNRGAYLVQGIAHCSACHEARNSLGATRSNSGPSGGLVLNWYAPALTSAREAGLRNWTEADIVAFLKTGRTLHATAMGIRRAPRKTRGLTGCHPSHKLSTIARSPMLSPSYAAHGTTTPTASPALRWRKAAPGRCGKRR